MQPGHRPQATDASAHMHADDKTDDEEDWEVEEDDNDDEEEEEEGWGEQELEGLLADQQNDLYIQYKYEDTNEEEEEKGQGQGDSEGGAGAGFTREYSWCEDWALVREVKHVLKPSGRLQRRYMTASEFWQEVLRDMLQRQWSGKRKEWQSTWLSLHDSYRTIQNDFWHHRDHQLRGFIVVTPGSSKAALSMTPAQREAAGGKQELVSHCPPLIVAEHEGPSSAPFYLYKSKSYPSRGPASALTPCSCCLLPLLTGCIALPTVVQRSPACMCRQVVRSACWKPGAC